MSSIRLIEVGRIRSYPDPAKFGEFMKAVDEKNNGEALTSLGWRSE